jgi:hypothetical protein
MSLLIELPPETEAQVREAAEAEGVDVSTFLREAAEAHLRQYDPALPLTDSELLARINRGFPETFWNRYRKLIAKRRAETLARKEQQELIGMSDQLEAWRVERLQYLIKLAQLRQTTVNVLMQDLGIRPTVVE